MRYTALCLASAKINTAMRKSTKRKPAQVGGMVYRAILKKEVLRTIEDMRTAMGLQAYLGQDANRIANTAGRLFFIIAHAAGAAGFGNSPEGGILAGASCALGDIVETPSMLESQRAAIISGMGAVDRLLPNLSAEQLADGAIAFERILRDAAELRTVDVQSALSGSAVYG